MPASYVNVYVNVADRARNSCPLTPPLMRLFKDSPTLLGLRDQHRATNDSERSIPRWSRCSQCASRLSALVGTSPTALFHRVYNRGIITGLLI